MTRPLRHLDWCPERAAWNQRMDGRSKAGYCLFTWTEEGVQHLCVWRENHAFLMHGCACGVKHAGLS